MKRRFKNILSKWKNKKSNIRRSKSKMQKVFLVRVRWFRNGRMRMTCRNSTTSMKYSKSSTNHNQSLRLENIKKGIKKIWDKAQYFSAQM
jgi:hypothetical protein